MFGEKSGADPLFVNAISDGGCPPFPSPVGEGGIPRAVFYHLNWRTCGRACGPVIVPVFKSWN